MALATGTYSSAQTNLAMVSAQPGKIIRITKLVFTAWGATRLTLVSDPGGAGQFSITPPLHVQGNGGSALVLRLGRGHALVGERGKALGITTGFPSTPVDHSVLIWYEVVT